MVQLKAISFIKENKKAILWGLLIVFLLYVAYKVYKKLTEEKPKEIRLREVLEGGVIRPNFDPLTWAEGFEDEFIGWQFSYEGRNNYLEQLNKLNDNELISVYNYWNDKYFNKSYFGVKYGSMKEILTDEVQPLFTTGQTVNYFSLILDRFNGLNLV